MKILSKRHRKAIVNIEFIVSVVIFLVTVSFVIVNTFDILPSFHRETLNEDAKSKMYQFSEFILDEGYPKNWNSDAANAKRFGLSSQDKYILDSGKVSAMNDLCKTPDGYKKIRGSFENYQIKLVVEKLNGTKFLECQPQIRYISSEFYLDRFAVLNGDVVRIRVTIIG